MKRYLVTTSDRRLWRSDVAVAFLSAGCVPYARQSDLQGIDYFFFPPYGLGQEQKDIDHKLTRSIEDFLYSNACPLLNEALGLNLDRRGWQIVMGKWLRRFSDLMINRVNTLKAAIKTGKCTDIEILDIPDPMASRDSLEFVWNTNDPEWNNRLYGRILELSETSSLNLHYIPCESVRDTIHYFARGNVIKRTLRILLQWIHRLFKSLLSSRRVMMLSSYLSSRWETALNVKLGQFPLPYRSLLDYPHKAIDGELRTRLSGALAKGQSRDDLVRFIAANLFFEVLPASFLEDSEAIQARPRRSPWPARPRIIFTSNAFDTDEVFKWYVANQVARGSKYFVGQHGNNYGTFRYMYHTNEELVSDCFFTWGWQGDLKQHRPAFIFKRRPTPPPDSRRDGDLVLMQLSLPSRFETWDVVAEHQKYFDDQVAFVSGLSARIKDRLIIRLHRDFRFHEWDELDRWSALDPNLHLDTGDVPVDQILLRGRVIVHSYDSTGILETLSANIPTLAFWQNGYDHLQESAVSDYRELEQVGIIHLSVQSLLHHIEKHWDDLEEWWRSEPVQSARGFFCDKYVRTVEGPIALLTKSFH